MNVHVHEKQRPADDINLKIVGRRPQRAFLRRHLEKDYSALHGRAVVHVHVVDHAGMVGMSFRQVAEGMKDLIRHHPDGLMVLKQFPFFTRVCNHALHYVVDGDEIGQYTVSSRILSEIQP